MNRIATIPMQQILIDSVRRTQGQLSVSQQQLASGKKISNFSDLGAATARDLSARSLLARQVAQGKTATRVGTTMALYDSSLTELESTLSALKQSITVAVGTGSTTGLDDTIKSAFAQFGAALNAREGGNALFGGSQTGGNPFTPQTLAEAAATPADQAFASDAVQVSARVGDNTDLEVGIDARAIGSDALAAFTTLQQAGTLGNAPSATQMTALKDAVAKLGSGVDAVRAANGDNGRKQALVETLATRAQARSTLLESVVSQNEDADLGQVAIDLSREQSLLQASYSVIGKLNGLSLADYLR